MCIRKSFNLMFKNDNYIVDKNYFTMDQDFYIEAVVLIDFKEIFNSNQNICIRYMEKDKCNNKK